DLTRPEYAAWLSQMLLIHRALESALAELRPADHRLEPVVLEHFKEPNLVADLAALGAGEAEPLPATRRILERIAAARRAQPPPLLGLHYGPSGRQHGNPL